MLHGGSARGRVATNHVEVADQCELHRRVVVSAGVPMDISVVVLPREGERLSARCPFGRKPAISCGDLEADPLEGMVHRESDRERGNSNREASAGSVDPRDCRGAGTPTVKQCPVDQQRIVPARAVSTIGLCGRHNPAQDEPHLGTGRGRRGRRSRILERQTVPPQGRTTTAHDTQHERTDHNAATSPCRREPVEERRSSRTTAQDLSLRRRELIRGIHPRKDTPARSPGQVPSVATETRCCCHGRAPVPPPAGPARTSGLADEREAVGGLRHPSDAASLGAH
jgi:hypothetical protein